MCLIIHKKPNFDIPYDKFESAVINNPDGYGLTYPDGNGKLHTYRTPDKPDPEVLYKEVNEELGGADVLLHLRFNTAGETNLRNAHPFSILEKATDGIDLRMAHNGTIYDYKTKAEVGESDTRAFARLFVRPLFKRLSKGMDLVDILKDPFTKELLEDKLPKTSVLSFLDGEGNSLNINPTGNGGKEEKGWYYSNVYSFNPNHRKPTYPKTYQTYGYDSDYYKRPNYNNNYLPTTTKQPEMTEDMNVERFTKKFDLTLKQVYTMADETIEELVLMDGDSAVLLIKELLATAQGLEESRGKALSQLVVLKKKVGGAK